jgi:hypothetical protein
MASITGSGGDYSENYSRRGNAARGNEQNQNFLAEKLAQVMAALEGAGQGIAGLFQGGAPNTTANNILITGDTPNDPRITGTTEDPRVTQSGGRGGVDVRRPITGTQVEMAEDTRRGGGQSSIPAMGSRGGGGTGGGGTPPPTGPGQSSAGGGGGNRGGVNVNPGALVDRNTLLGGAFSNENIGRNVGRLGYLAPAAAAAQSYIQGKPVEALAGGAAGLGTTALVRSAGRSVGGRIGTALQFAAPLVGLGAQQLAGGAAQKAYQRETGSGDPNQLSTQLGRLEKLQQLGLEGNIATLNAVNAGTKDMLTHAMETEKTYMQSMFPLLEQQRNNDVVRQQQIMNSMGQNFAMLGGAAVTGKLALGAQANAGANLRTMMTAAPYANAVLQAPNITF